MMPSVLFECHHLYYLPQLRPIIVEMQSRGGYQLAASIPRTVNAREQALFKDEIAALGLELMDAREEEDRLRLIASRAFEVIIVGNVGRLECIVAPHSLVVMVYHGIGLKNSYYRDFSPRIDLLAVESEARLQSWQALGIDCGVTVGMPKLDALATGPDRREEIVARLNLDPQRPTVLYAPTFYPSSFPAAVSGIRQLAENANVIIKLHHFSWYQKRYRYQSELAAELAQVAGIALVPAEIYDILPYYQAADALISDISSTLFEYLALDRPILQTGFASLRWRHRFFPWRVNRRMDRQRAAQVNFTRVVSHPGELAALTLAELEHPASLANQRKAAAALHLHHVGDGQASARLVDAIDAALKARAE